MTGTKVDFKRYLPKLYGPKNTSWEKIEIPEMQFVMIDGEGDPNTAREYQDAVEALYGVAYPLKFLSKKQLGRDYVIPPLEGLWYADDMSIFEKRDKNSYRWTMMIMQPDWITQAMYDRIIGEARAKKPDLPHSRLRLEKYTEGASLQRLHIGSYDDEAPSLHELHHDLMPAQDLDFNGHHHEIYLSDPRKTTPDKLKTILRQPVKKRS